MTPSAQLRAQAAALLDLADRLDGVATATPSPRGELATVSEMMETRLLTIKQAAGALRMSEKRLRRVAPQIGAQVELGGRKLVDMRVFTSHLSGENRAISGNDFPIENSENNNA